MPDPIWTLLKKEVEYSWDHVTRPKRKVRYGDASGQRTWSALIGPPRNIKIANAKTFSKARLRKLETRAVLFIVESQGAAFKGYKVFNLAVPQADR